MSDSTTTPNDNGSDNVDIVTTEASDVATADDHDDKEMTTTDEPSEASAGMAAEPGATTSINSAGAAASNQEQELSNTQTGVARATPENGEDWRNQKQGHRQQHASDTTVKRRPLRNSASSTPSASAQEGVDMEQSRPGAFAVTPSNTLDGNLLLDESARSDDLEPPSVARPSSVTSTSTYLQQASEKAQQDRASQEAIAKSRGRVNAPGVARRPSPFQAGNVESVAPSSSKSLHEDDNVDKTGVSVSSTSIGSNSHGKRKGETRRHAKEGKGNFRTSNGSVSANHNVEAGTASTSRTIDDETSSSSWNAAIGQPRGSASTSGRENVDLEAGGNTNGGEGGVAMPSQNKIASVDFTGLPQVLEAVVVIDEPPPTNAPREPKQMMLPPVEMPPPWHNYEGANRNRCCGVNCTWVICCTTCACIILVFLLILLLAVLQEADLDKIADAFDGKSPAPSMAPSMTLTMLPSVNSTVV